MKPKSGSTNPAEVARAAGVGERKPRRAEAGGVLARIAAWRRERRERRWEEIASADGRAAQVRYDENRTFGDTPSSGGGGSGL